MCRKKNGEHLGQISWTTYCTVGSRSSAVLNTFVDFFTRRSKKEKEVCLDKVVHRQNRSRPTVDDLDPYPPSQEGRGGYRPNRARIEQMTA